MAYPPLYDITLYHPQKGSTSATMPKNTLFDLDKSCLLVAVVEKGSALDFVGLIGLSLVTTDDRFLMAS